MATVKQLVERRNELQAELREVRKQIAAQHGRSDGEDVLDEHFPDRDKSGPPPDPRPDPEVDPETGKAVDTKKSTPKKSAEKK